MRISYHAITGDGDGDSEKDCDGDRSVPFHEILDLFEILIDQLRFHSDPGTSTPGHSHSNANNNSARKDEFIIQLDVCLSLIAIAIPFAISIPMYVQREFSKVAMPSYLRRRVQRCLPTFSGGIWESNRPTTHHPHPHPHLHTDQSSSSLAPPSTSSNSLNTSSAVNTPTANSVVSAKRRRVVARHELQVVDSWTILQGAMEMEMGMEMEVGDGDGDGNVVFK